MKCLSISVIWEHCIECDKITPFINSNKCFYCGCDSPFGEFCDDNITFNEFDDYVNKHTTIIGRIDLIDKSSLIFLNLL